MASLISSAARFFFRLWNPPRFQGVGFLIASRNLLRAYCVAAELGIADLVHQRPRTLAELAEATQTDPTALHRILRALAAFGVFREDRHGRFHMTRRAGELLSDEPGSLRWWLVCVGRPEMCLGFCHSVESVRTGVPLFELAHKQGFYDYLATHPELRATFSKAMSTWTDWQRRELVRAFDFGRFHTVLDVGGGTGSLLEHILASHPRLRGILVDQPVPAGLATARFAEAGLSDRCDVVCGSFFDELPDGADLCILKHVVCDWHDNKVRTILRNCQRALPPGGTLLLLEAVIDPRNGTDRTVKLFDLEMQAFSGGGARTEAELKSLLEDSGFRFVRVRASAVPDCQIVEARRIESRLAGATLPAEAPDES